MFELLNVKWGDPTFGTPSGEISWSSELNGDLPIAPGFDIDDIENSLRAAFDTWESVAAVDFEEVATGGAVSITNDPLDAPVVGLAGPFPVDRADFFTMTSAEVIFSETLDIPSRPDADITWSPFGGGDTVNFFAVALHEIGHVIGLEHPDDPTQIMNAVIQVDELGLGDIQGAQFLYGTDGDDVEVEPGLPENAEEIGLDDGGSAVPAGSGSGGGLVFGLLALIAALFTGGTSFAALAAGQVAMSSDDDTDDMPDDPDGSFDPSELDAADVAAIFNSHHHHHHIGPDGMVYHGFTVPEMLPSIDFTARPNPCGCFGLCEHILDQEEPADSFLI